MVRTARLCIGIAFVAFVACGDDDGGARAPLDAGAIGGFTLEVNSELGVLQGGAAQLEFVVRRGAGFMSAVTVELAELPAGVTASSSQIAAASVTGALEIAAAPSSAQGAAHASIRASGGGVTAVFPLRLLVRGAPGTLDTSFGAGGVVAVDFVPQDVLVQPDHKLVLVGQRDADVAVRRLASNGASDAFGAGGLLLFPVMSAADEAAAVALQPDGQLVLAGHSGHANGVRDTLLARVTAAGALDPDFGRGGTAVLDISGGGEAGASDTARRAIVLPDGKIVAAVCLASRDLVMLRFDARGELDASYGTGGRVDHRLGEDADIAALVRQPDGKLLVAGKRRSDASSDALLYVLRLLPTGALDPDFGSGGKVELAAFGGTGSAAARALRLLNDGRILVGGASAAGGFMMRLLSNGMRDDAFGSGGAALTPDVVTGLASGLDGKVFFVAWSSADVKAIVGRLDASGKAHDPSFGAGAAIVLPPMMRGGRVVFTSDDRVVIVDSTGPAPPANVLRVWR